MLKPCTCALLLDATDMQTVVDVAAIGAICATTRPTIADFSGVSSFKDKVERAFAASTDGDIVRARRAMAVLLMCNDYETAYSLQGIGGCAVPCFQDMLHEVLPSVAM